MELRPYQDRVVANAIEKLRVHRSTIAVAPTGAGKTIIMGGLGRRAASVIGNRVLVLQHRQELVEQNREKFAAVNRDWCVSTFDADTKRWARASGYAGGATFAMVQSLKGHLQRMEPVDLVMMDECHHAVSPTQLAILERARELNPDVAVFGVTATAARADKKGLGEVFKTVADQITFEELFDGGYLVRPRGLAIDGELAKQLATVGRKRSGEYDLDAVARIIDHEPVTRAVFEAWQEHSAHRQTVIFAATVDHCEHVAAFFRAQGVGAEVVSERTPKPVRKAVIAALHAGRLQVVVNVDTLTEGFDCPPIATVALLRPTAFESKAIQMIGRGLRPVDLSKHPHAGAKTDCIVMDFGATLANLGGLEQILDLRGDTAKRTPGPELSKPCRQCRCAIPMRARSCSLCGYEYPRESVQLPIIVPGSFEMKPVDLLLKQSPFSWFAFHSRAKVAVAERVWAIVFQDTSGLWHTFASRPELEQPQQLSMGTLNVALSRGDDWMREHADPRLGRGPWTSLPPTPKQLEQLRRLKVPHPEQQTRYSAACWITAKFAKREIRKLLATAKAALADQLLEDTAVLTGDAA